MRIVYYALSAIVAMTIVVSPAGTAVAADEGSTVEGTGFTLFEMESIKG